MPTLYTASSATFAAVTSCIGVAVAGDTVVIPSGTLVIDDSNHPLSCSKGIQIKGSGVGVTTIRDDVTRSGGAPTIDINIPDGERFWMSDFTYTCTTSDPSIYNKGCISVSGNQNTVTDPLLSPFRFHHIFVGYNPDSFLFIRGPHGLVDHVDANPGIAFLISIQRGPVGPDFGDTSWITPIDWAGPNNVFIEDCNVHYYLSAPLYQPGNFTDCDAGGRMVNRYNTIINGFLGSHGADSGDRIRGSRVMDIYENHFQYDDQAGVDFCAWIRGGTGTFHHNTIEPFTTPNPVGWTLNFALKCDLFRDTDGPSVYSGSWGICDGTTTGAYTAFIYDLVLGGGLIRGVDAPGTGTSDDMMSTHIGDVDHYGSPSLHPVNNTSDPIYLWSNTNNLVAYTFGTPYSTTAHVQRGVDVIEADKTAGGGGPGYTTYTYPHPLQGVTYDGSTPSITKTRKGKVSRGRH